MQPTSRDKRVLSIALCFALEKAAGISGGDGGLGRHRKVTSLGVLCGGRAPFEALIGQDKSDAEWVQNATVNHTVKTSFRSDAALDFFSSLTIRRDNARLLTDSDERNHAASMAEPLHGRTPSKHLDAIVIDIASNKSEQAGRAHFDPQAASPKRTS